LIVYIKIKILFLTLTVS